MYDQVIAWAVLAVLLLLCLPFAGLQKMVLEVYAWALRLALLTVLGAAAYLWFRPGDLPREVADVLNGFPRVRAVLPDPGTPSFGVCAASVIVLTLLPLLAILDVSRKLAGWRLRRLRALAAEPKVIESPPASLPGPAPVARRVNRRAAADTLAEAASRKPPRPADQLES
jgi:hypothetical protein